MKLFSKVSALALLAVMTLSSCTTDSFDDNVETLEMSLVETQAKAIELEILNLINDHRRSLGLKALEDMSIVKSVAYSHTDYMVDNDVVSHDNFYTRSSFLKSNVGAKKVSENVAYGFGTAQGVVNAWIKSENHKANLEGDYTNFDISAEKNDNGRWYFTNIFIKK
ncbi:CAP domain-containing protein [Cognatitamlana onchidii]|uniref:CAP domain-containing protein n=1 Tax=Cognatitamlana onchidii TaxID=2562860 RepID=UPI0010A5CF07|nr:CAP domain-containing protein [Algibacter onchidii]